jgi:hypothetical protein
MGLRAALASAAAVALEASPIPARVPQPVWIGIINGICKEKENRETHLVQCTQRIELHDSEIVAEYNECGDVDDVLRAMP